jgi:hypothetical protein
MDKFSDNLCPFYVSISLFFKYGHMPKSAVDSAYLNTLSAQSGSERVARANALLSLTASFFAHGVRQENPSFDERAVHVAVAKRIYMSEKTVLEMLEKISCNNVYSERFSGDS